MIAEGALPLKAILGQNRRIWLNPFSPGTLTFLNGLQDSNCAFSYIKYKFGELSFSYFRDYDIKMERIQENANVTPTPNQSKVIY